jgi:hypothetical protein
MKVETISKMWVLKSLKTPNNPNQWRLLTLIGFSSCVWKIPESRINCGLVWNLETRNIFPVLSLDFDATDPLLTMRWTENLHSALLYLTPASCLCLLRFGKTNTGPEKPTLLVSRESIVTFHFQHPPGHVFVFLSAVYYLHFSSGKWSFSTITLSVFLFVVGISGRINATLTSLFVEEWRHSNLLQFPEHWYSRTSTVSCYKSSVTLGTGEPDIQRVYFTRSRLSNPYPILRVNSDSTVCSFSHVFLVSVEMLRLKCWRGHWIF